MLAALLLLGAAGLVLAPAGAARASVGVGIQAAPVRLAGVAHPGQSVALPPVFVINAGTQPEWIRVGVQRLSRGSGRRVPASWIRPGVPGVHLAPHKAARISLELVVPAGARAGAYLSDIVATGAGPVSAGRANLGAAAATLLEFRVAPDPAPGFWASVLRQTLWALLIVVLAAAAWLAVYKAGVRVRVERRAVGYGPADERGGWHA
jgi:hypothetical protein